MASTPLKKRVIYGVLAMVVIAVAIAVKLIFFPSVKDDYFGWNQRNLRAAPFGIVMVRQTHFPKAMQKGIGSTNVKKSGKWVERMMGRNVSLNQLIGAAYGKNPDRVLLPDDAPKTNFDFLITAPGDVRDYLKKAIQKNLGYTAKTETRGEPALAAKVQDATLPGLVVSGADEKQGVKFDKGRLNFTHMRLQEFMAGFTRFGKTPVIDKTGLTNYYNFSISWTRDAQQRLMNPSTGVDTIKDILGGWGLILVPDTDQVEMLVVQRAS